MTQKIKRFPRKNYSIERSPLYQLSSKRRLAELLKIDIATIKEILAGSPINQYRIFKDPETKRLITEPVGMRKVVHQRLQLFLNRIVPPSYLHSAVKGRSYKSNAEAHCANKHSFKIDIHKFYQSVRFDCIHKFFLSALDCAPDIATILAKLCTVQTKKWGVHLPTGSCLSPVLSFLANKVLFDEIHALCEAEGCVVTIYVDDITVSGERANSALLMKVATKIHNAGYRYHKIKTYRDSPALITGLIVRDGRVNLPYARCRYIRELVHALRVSENPEMKRKILGSLVGRLSEAEYVSGKYRSLRLQITKKYQAQWQEIVAGRVAKSRNKLLAQKRSLRKRSSAVAIAA